MHYLTLGTLKIPPQEPTPQKDQEIQEQLAALEQEKQNAPDSWLTDIFIQKCNSLRDSFSRAVASEAGRILERYSAGTTNPDYLEFCDKTEDVVQEYDTGTIDCFRLAEGSIVPSYDERVMCFVIRNGRVYKCRYGPLQHEKRNKQAKRMKALPGYPLKNLFSSLENFAEEYYGFHNDHGKFGYYYNPNILFDWYSIGGRWPELFLVKETCQECSIGERSWNAEEESLYTPEGYKWVCAARKKDIEWQAANDWRLLKAKERFKSLEKLFTTGERDDGIRGVVTNDGILYLGDLIYQKGDCEESYLTRHGFQEIQRYPVSFYSYLNETDFQMQDSFTQSEASDGTCAQKNWQDTLQEYIDSLPDDEVLVGIDCHL